MSIEAALVERLAAVSGVTDVIGTRLYPVQAPLSAQAPYGVAQVIAERHLHDYTGASGLAYPRVQISVYAATSVTAAAAGEAIRQALQGWTGTAAGVAIRSIDLENRITQAVPPSDGTDVPSYRCALDFLISHAISVPSF